MSLIFSRSLTPLRKLASTSSFFFLNVLVNLAHFSPEVKISFLEVEPAALESRKGKRDARIEKFKTISKQRFRGGTVFAHALPMSNELEREGKKSG